MLGWEPLGVHSYRLEEDLLFWRPAGEVQASEATRVCKMLARFIAGNGYALWLIDAERSLPVGFETRRTYASWLEQASGPLFIAAFHAPLPARTTAALVTRGAQLRHAAQVVNEVYDSEAMARAALHAHRQRWLAEAGRSHAS